MFNKLSVTALAVGLSSMCLGAGNVLIITGAAESTEPGTTSSVVTNLQTYMTAAGETTTLSDGIPGSFAGYTQVWDVRWFNSAALSSGDITNYVNYLHGGGAMFVMGENAGFATRNASVVSLIGAVGGGSLTYVVPIQTQTVLAPFTGPHAVTTITYAASGGTVGSGAVNHTGNGLFMTVDTNNNGSGLIFPPGSMTAAPAGTLAVVFDVNFMETSADANSQAFTQNLIGYVAAPVAIGVSATPAPSTVSLLLLGAAGLGLLQAWRRRQDRQTQA